MRFRLRVFAAACLLLHPAMGNSVITSTDELRKAGANQQVGREFRLEGIAVIPPYLARGPFFLMIGDTLTPLYGTPSNLTERIAIGDRLAVSGVMEKSSIPLRASPNCREIRVISHGRPPDAPVVRMEDFLRGDTPSNQLLAIHGTIQDVFPDDIDPAYAHVVLQDGPCSITLTCNCPRSDVAGFHALLGCDVVATGVSGRGFSRNRRHIGPHLTIAGTNALRVIRRSRDDLFNAPVFRPDAEFNPHLLADMGPRRIRGTVIATWHCESLLVRTAERDVVRVELAYGPLPRPNSSIEAVGRIESDLFGIFLTRAHWRPSGLPPTDDEPPARTTIAELFTTRFEAPAINTLQNGNLLKVRGTVKSIASDETGRTRMVIAEGPYALRVLCEADADAFRAVEEGSVVEITGICVLDSDVWRPNVRIPKIRGLFLVLRTPDDITVLKTPPWWTPVRFVVLLSVLLALFAAIVVWNATLRVLVVRRSREVIRAQERKLESELRIDERTRLAAELYDNTVQNLTAVAYQISAAQKALGAADSLAHSRLDTAAKMLKSCRTNLRQCLWDLRNDVLDEPDFEEAIRRTVEPVGGDAKLSVRFSGRRELVSDSTAHAVLNILRELVSNAVRHGKAGAVSIAGEARPGLLRFSVRDDGIGFDPDRRPRQDEGHFGLDGILERLRMLHGTLSIRSHVGRGTYIRVTIQPGATAT